jgi:hypothetical protein
MPGSTKQNYSRLISSYCNFGSIITRFLPDVNYAGFIKSNDTILRNCCFVFNVHYLRAREPRPYLDKNIQNAKYRPRIIPRTPLALIVNVGAGFPRPAFLLIYCLVFNLNIHGLRAREPRPVCGFPARHLLYQDFKNRWLIKAPVLL